MIIAISQIRKVRFQESVAQGSPASERGVYPNSLNGLCMWECATQATGREDEKRWAESQLGWMKDLLCEGPGSDILFSWLHFSLPAALFYSWRNWRSKSWRRLPRVLWRENSSSGYSTTLGQRPQWEPHLYKDSKVSEDLSPETISILTSLLHIPTKGLQPHPAWISGECQQNLARGSQNPRNMPAPPRLESDSQRCL